MNPTQEIPTLNTFGELLLWGIRQLETSVGSEEAPVSAERLLAEISGRERFELILAADSHFPAGLGEKFRELALRRKKHIPLAYLLGKAHFWNEVLEVGEGCLIPRPETEILVEKFLEISGFKPDRYFSFLDLGAGSGAIGIALLRIFLKARATFSDVSKKALALTRANLVHYGLLERAEIVCSDLFENSPPPYSSSRETGGGQEGGWDVILSNPPYLAEQDWKNAQPEILFEPREALDGGKDGLDFYRRITRESPAFLKPGGWLGLEVGIHQARTVAGWLEQNSFFEQVQIFKDHAGIERVVMGQVRHHSGGQAGPPQRTFHAH